VGRHSGDRLDRADRLCVEKRDRQLADGRHAAKSQRTIFVDRSRRQQTGDAIADIVDRLSNGTSVVLFAEGTSSDGNRVLPFAPR